MKQRGSESAKGEPSFNTLSLRGCLGTVQVVVGAWTTGSAARSAGQPRGAAPSSPSPRAPDGALHGQRHARGENVLRGRNQLLGVAHHHQRRGCQRGADPRGRGHGRERGPVAPHVNAGRVQLLSISTPCKSHWTRTRARCRSTTSTTTTATTASPSRGSTTVCAFSRRFPFAPRTTR